MRDNAIILSITNRNRGFVNPVLNTQTSFLPASETPEERFVRHTLMLDDETTDFYVKAALCVVDMFHHVRMEFKETVRLYELHRLPRAADSIVGAKLLPSHSGMAKILRRPLEWPVQMSMTFTVVGSTLKTTIGGVDYFAPFTETATKRYRVEWPVETGISGDLKTLTPIDSSFTMTINHEPVSYPASKVVSILDGKVEVLDLLQRHSLIGEWYAADNAHEKIAVCLLALGLDNNSVYDNRI